MFQRKEQVDAVLEAGRAMYNEAELKMKGNLLAEMYMQASAYDSALEWASNHVEVNGNDPAAHKLLGECYELLQKPEEAIRSFLTSLRINGDQVELIDKMAKLAEELILPIVMEPAHQIELIKVLIELGLLTKAFEHCFAIEMEFNESFSTNPAWYNTMSLLLEKLANPEASTTMSMSVTWNFSLLEVICLERRIHFALAADSPVPEEVTGLVYKLDQIIYKIKLVSSFLNSNQKLADSALDHYYGQFCFHAASLLFKTKNILNRPLLLHAYHCGLASDMQPWLDQQDKRIIQQWRRQGAFRCVQAGRLLLMKGTKSLIIDRKWRENVYESLFGELDQAAGKVTTSYLVNVKCDKLANCLGELPLLSAIETYEEVAAGDL